MSQIQLPKITDRKIRLGFVGCGRISNKHFEALEQLSDKIEVIAVCDTNQEKATVSSDRLKCKTYSDLESMLKSEKIDLVTIATPNGLHPDQVMKVADFRIPVITEKPMAINLNDGLKMHEYCLSKKVPLLVIHQNRFNDTVQEIWKAIEQNRFGKIYMITSNVFWTRPQEYYDKEGSWHGTKELDGGAFYTQASHYIDLMQWLARSKPKMVSAQLKTLARNIETEDSGTAQIEWQNGILGAVNVTMLTYPKNLEGSVTILGEKGTVKLGGVAMNQIEHWDFAEKTEKDNNIMSSNYETSSVYGFGHVRYYENIVNCFKGTETPLIDAYEGLSSLTLLDAIHQSSTENKRVFL